MNSFTNYVDATGNEVFYLVEKFSIHKFTSDSTFSAVPTYVETYTFEQSTPSFNPNPKRGQIEISEELDHILVAINTMHSLDPANAVATMPGET
jgi:hypothetical protein